MRGSRRAWPWVVLCLAGALAAPFAAGAAPQTSDQQGCINDMNKYGVRVAKSQNRADVDCVKNAGRGLTFRLGIPPQAQTAQACLTNDVGGKVAKDSAKLQDREAKSCLAEPGQLPGFGYAGSATADAAERAAALAIVAGLFGPDLDAAIVLESADRDGSRCQSDVLRYTGDLFYAIWKEALTAKKNVLKGSARLTGSGPVASATDLEAEMIAVVQADARGKIAKAAQKLHDKTTQRCAEAATPIGQLFRGACGTSSSLDGLGDCAEAQGRGAFFQSLASADALSIDCDLLDNGVGDLSCESAELREHVLEPHRLRARRLVAGAHPDARRAWRTSRSSSPRRPSTTARSTPCWRSSRASRRRSCSCAPTTPTTPRRRSAARQHRQGAEAGQGAARRRRAAGSWRRCWSTSGRTTSTWRPGAASARSTTSARTTGSRSVPTSSAPSRTSCSRTPSRRRWATSSTTAATG